MSLLSVSDWQDFLNTVGGDFYDLVHGKDENSTEFTRIDYNNAVQYKGVYFVFNNYNGSTNYSIPCIVDFNLCQGVGNIVSFEKLCIDSNRRTPESISSAKQFDSVDFSIDCPNSFLVENNPYWIGSDNLVWMRDYSNTWQSQFFKYSFNGVWHYNSTPSQKTNISDEAFGQKLLMNNTVIDYYSNYDGYNDWFGNGAIPIFYNFDDIKTYTAPSILNSSPLVINSTNINVNSSWVTNIKNSYVNSGDTITNYTYNIDNDNYITVNYSTDGNGLPTGYIDLQPTGNISFDDLFDMFNTILAPLVGVGLDLPDWNDYAPPAVTGDVNVNIDLPDVTWTHPVETIKPIESEINYIISDGFPELPSITMNVDSSVAAVNSGFTFLDGCGLLMPFLIVAVVRLLISKFRGDS